MSAEFNIAKIQACYGKKPERRPDGPAATLTGSAVIRIAIPPKAMAEQVQQAPEGLALEQASEQVASGQIEATPKWYSRFMSKEHWREPLKDTFIWFLFGLLLCTMISMFSPYRVIFVGTESIPKGVYILNEDVGAVRYGDTLSFSFKPKTDWVIERYAGDGSRIFTKHVKGLPGDIVTLTDSDTLVVCRSMLRQGVTSENRCENLGSIRKTDSQGRQMQSWVAKDSPYVIQPGEVWMFAPHERSLDSRYYGPIAVEHVHGRATPLLTW